MAPERKNRSIDSRSDAYARDATFYEVLNGNLPFTASDPVQWLDCDIARHPSPPHDRAKSVPACVPAIVMKLDAKTPKNGTRLRSARKVIFGVASLNGNRINSSRMSHRPMTRQIACYSLRDCSGEPATWRSHSLRLVVRSPAIPESANPPASMNRPNRWFLSFRSSRPSAAFTCSGRLWAS